jgi:divalent metal cation (Fe/Co/Zn/Cd) transporter
MTNEETAVKQLILVSLKCLLSLIKGWQVFGNSYALIADAIESTTDILLPF